MQSKELFSNLCTDTEPSFHLAAILRGDMYQWYYENYINMLFRIGRVCYLDFKDNNIDESYRQFYDERVVMRYDEIDARNDLIKNLTDKIDNDFYTFTHLDKYYVSANVWYNDYHYVHPVIVTGYDSAAEYLICIDFNPNIGPVKINIPYTEFIEAFIGCGQYYANTARPNILDEMITCFKLKKDYRIDPVTNKRRYKHYTFNIEIFLSELHDYLFSEYKTIRGAEHFAKSNDVVYGISVYDYFIRFYKDYLKDSERIRFKSLYDLGLHKKMMKFRLNFVKANYSISSKCIEEIDRYDQIVDIFEKLKLLNIKCNVMDKRNANSLSKNSKFSDKLISELIYAKKLEFDILQNIYCELKNNDKRISYNENLYTDYTVEAAEETQHKVTVTLDKPQTIEKIDIIYDRAAVFEPGSVSYVTFDNGICLTLDDEESKDNIKVLKFKPMLVKSFDLVSEQNKHINSDSVSFNIYTLSDHIQWDFNSNLFINVDLKSDTDITKSICATVYGRDPSIQYPVNLNADDLKYIYIKYRTDCSCSTAEMFFITQNDYTYKRKFAIGSGSEYYEYILDLEDHKEWKGMMKTMRFDMVNYDNTSERGSCDIEYILINNVKPVYVSKKDFAGEQGLNGWGYYLFDRGITYRELSFENDRYLLNRNNKLEIGSDYQTSYNQLASARIWTCPSDGEYRIHCDIRQESDNKRTEFCVKKNHINIHKLLKELADRDTMNLDFTEHLERGETLRFEYYNDNENTHERIEIDVQISKV